MEKVLYTARYMNVAVEVVCERTIPGGVAVDVRRPTGAQGWPWTVSRFVAAKAQLTGIVGGAS